MTNGNTKCDGEKFDLNMIFSDRKEEFLYTHFDFDAFHSNTKKKHINIRFMCCYIVKFQNEIIMYDLINVFCE